VAKTSNKGAEARATKSQACGFEAVVAAAEAIDLAKTQTLALDEGQSVQQGDVYITLVSKDFKTAPANANELKPVPVQLAPGATRGSRHCLATTEGITAFSLNKPKECDGPLLLAPNGLEVVHPEHADFILTTPGLYAVTYQQALLDVLRRATD